MAAKRPTSTPVEVASTETAPTGAAADVADPALAAPDSTPAQPTEAQSTEAQSTEAVADPAQAEKPVAAAPPGQQVVYVQAPKPFVKKGNRGFGILIAVLSTVIFAALYAVALVVIQVIEGDDNVDFAFVATTDFWALPVMFIIGFVLLVLVVNRSGWFAHVLGSIFVGLFVYFGGTGAILLLSINQIPSNRVAEAFTGVIFSPTLIIAGLLAREVSLWLGAAIAARGRKVRARNVDARVLYDQEIAAKRAEYERANAGAAAQASPQASAAEAPVSEPAADAVAP